MSRIILDVECPNCNSEDMNINYNENGFIDCFCNDCRHLYNLDETIYMLYKDEEL